MATDSPPEQSTDMHATLEATYCPPLDPALFAAIISDYDLTTPADLAAARSMLDALRSAAEADAADDAGQAFDASGSGGLAHSGGLDGSMDRHDGYDAAHSVSSAAGVEFGRDGLARDLEALSVVSGSEGLVSWSGSGSGSGSSSGGGDGHVFSSEDREMLDGMEGMADEQKLEVLREMFPLLGAWTVAHVLKKEGAKGWERVIGELLNLCYYEYLEQEQGQGKAQSNEQGLGSEKLARKGVDAFAEDAGGVGAKKRMGRSRKKKGGHGSRVEQDQDEGAERAQSLPAASGGSRTANVWNAGREDIEHLATNLHLSHPTVAAAYHRHGCSIQATLTALLDEQSTTSTERATGTTTKQEASIQAFAWDLSEAFPAIAMPHCTALVRLTYPSLPIAHELAYILIRPPSPSFPSSHTTTTTTTTNTTTPRSKPALSVRTNAQIRADLTPTYTPLNLSSSPPAPRTPHFPPSTSTPYSAHPRSSLPSRSSTLQTALSAAADSLVASQSSMRTGTLDLHGVRVIDATRIARIVVQSWWDAGGGRSYARGNKAARAGVLGVDGRWVREEEEDGGFRGAGGGGGGRQRVGRGSGAGGRGLGAGGGMSVGATPELRFVVGKGRHSAGGVAKIGPAVRKMLGAEGWRVVEEPGVLVVEGR